MIFDPQAWQKHKHKNQKAILTNKCKYPETLADFSILEDWIVVEDILSEPSFSFPLPNHVAAL